MVNNGFTGNLCGKASQVYSTLYYYDDLGRLLEERIPFDTTGTTIQYSVKKYYYDRNGNVISEKISNNRPEETGSFNRTSYEYDERDRLVKVVTYDDGVPLNYTQYYYDGAGNRIRMYTGLSDPLVIGGTDIITPGSDSDYSIVKYEYDRFNNLVKMTDPLSKEETYFYDHNKDLRRRIDRNGSVIDMEYTALGKLKKKSCGKFRDSFHECVSCI